MSSLASLITQLALIELEVSHLGKEIQKELFRFPIKNIFLVLLTSFNLAFSFMHVSFVNGNDNGNAIILIFTLLTISLISFTKRSHQIWLFVLKNTFLVFLSHKLFFHFNISDFDILNIINIFIIGNIKTAVIIEYLIYIAQVYKYKKLLSSRATVLSELSTLYDSHQFLTEDMNVIFQNLKLTSFK